MAGEACIGFDELSWAARGHGLASDERARLAAMSQDDRNDWVAEMARSAGSVIATEDRLGDDGLTYRAFWIERPAWYTELAWSAAVPVAALTERADLPAGPGVVIVTDDAGPPIPRAVHLVVAADRLSALADAPPVAAALGRCSDAVARWAATATPREVAALLGEHLRSPVVG